MIDKRLSSGIYRDDFLAVSSARKQQTDKFRKLIEAEFAKHGLGTTAEANIKIVNFLDITLNLNDGSFKPYCKPNNKPQYVHKCSNHPPSVIRNIPIGVNKRLSNISSSEKIFKENIEIYQKARKDSGYDFEFSYQPDIEEEKDEKVKKKNRKRNVI